MSGPRRKTDEVLALRAEIKRLWDMFVDRYPYETVTAKWIAKLLPYEVPYSTVTRQMRILRGRRLMTRLTRERTTHNRERSAQDNIHKNVASSSTSSAANFRDDLED